MKKIVNILISCVLFSCAYINVNSYYIVKEVIGDYKLTHSYQYSYIQFKDDKSSLSVVFIEGDEYKKEKIVIKYKIFKGIDKSEIKFLDDTKILSQKNKELLKEIKVDIVKIGEDLYLSLSLEFLEKLKGEITLNLGKIKIKEKVLKIPVFKMQRFKKTESITLLGELLHEAGHRNGPLYKKTEWIE